MALVGKTVGRTPTAANLEEIYVVPGSTNFEGHVIVCNQSAVATAFRISIAPAGAADDPKQYIAYDTPINGNTVYESSRFSITATDKVRVYNTLATCSFVLTGLERS